jgi:hypothetical protein
MKRRLVMLVYGSIALAIVLATGGAVAYWTTTGAGSGSADVGAPQPVTVLAATATPSSLLVPGGTADLVLQLDNPNADPVRVVAVSQRGTTVTPVGATGSGTACTDTNTGVTVPSRTQLSIPVASGTDVTVHLADGVAMSAASASGCQGATFRVPVDVVVQR